MLKLYYFKTDDFDEVEYVLMAKDKDEAHQLLLKHLRTIIEQYPRRKWLKTELSFWETINVHDPASYPEGYTLEEYEFGTVITIGEI